MTNLVRLPEPTATSQKDRALNSPRAKPIRVLQDGLSQGEYGLYTVLWALSGNPEDATKDRYREVSIGYERLTTAFRARYGAGSRNNVCRLLKALQRKLVLQVIACEDSSIRQGKTYRVFSMVEVTRRRWREAGFTHVVRSRTAVALVKKDVGDVFTASSLDTVPNQETVTSLESPKVARLSTVEGAQPDAPFRKAVGKCSRELTYQPTIDASENNIDFSSPTGGRSVLDSEVDRVEAEVRRYLKSRREIKVLPDDGIVQRIASSIGTMARLAAWAHECDKIIQPHGYGIFYYKASRLRAGPDLDKGAVPPRHPTSPFTAEIVARLEARNG